MASIDVRIRREAKLADEEQAAAEKRRLIRLRGFLSDEATNMFHRCVAADATIRPRDRRTKAAKWLRLKTYDQTYRDHSETEKQVRTRERFELLLLLASGNTELLMREYGAALDRVFPIPSELGFEWAPRLVQSDEGTLTVRHHWRRRKITPTSS